MESEPTKDLLWSIVEEPKRLYRYEDIAYVSGSDEWDYPTSDYTLKVELLEYQVLKRTRKGVWINYKYGGRKRFVLLNARKKFAYATKEEALKSFIARKKSQIKILKDKLDRAERALYIAETTVQQNLQDRTLETRALID
jgi:hypothetical protein